MSDQRFLADHTVIATPPLVPELRLHLATEITPIWHATETFLDQSGIAPPFWAFAWPGGQLIARHVLDRPETVRGLRVLDFACGGGIAAIACARAGAMVEACDIDPLARVATRANAALNGVEVRVLERDVTQGPMTWDLIVCGDVCYEAPMTAHIMPWLRACAATGRVWVADPGRAYLPPGLTPLLSREVPTTRELEDRESRLTTLYDIAP